MLKSEVFPYYRQCCNELERVYDLFKQRFDIESVDILCDIRGYVKDSSQYNFLVDNQICCCDFEDTKELGDLRLELGLVSNKDNFILANRFIVPITDISGKLAAFVGYYPDYKKYITTPSPFFSKEEMFFNFHDAYELSWKEYSGFVIVVEGIFDCLSLKSIGLPVVATMGATVSKAKGELLRMFNKVLAIPDDDDTGRKALNRYSRRGWQVPSNTTFLKFDGGYMNFNGTKLHCKDMDNFVSWYEESDVREILLSYRDSREDIEELHL